MFIVSFNVTISPSFDKLGVVNRSPVTARALRTLCTVDLPGVAVRAYLLILESDNCTIIYIALDLVEPLLYHLTCKYHQVLVIQTVLPTFYLNHYFSILKHWCDVFAFLFFYLISFPDALPDLDCASPSVPFRILFLWNSFPFLPRYLRSKNFFNK